MQREVVAVCPLALTEVFWADMPIWTVGAGAGSGGVRLHPATMPTALIRSAVEIELTNNPSRGIIPAHCRTATIGAHVRPVGLSTARLDRQNQTKQHRVPARGGSLNAVPLIIQASFMPNEIIEQNLVMIGISFKIEIIASNHAMRSRLGLSA